RYCTHFLAFFFFFFFQAEDGIRDFHVTGVQTCALPICTRQQRSRMAANSTRNTLSRQWELLKLLPSRGPGLTAAQITQLLNDEHGHDINKRTVERDLQELSRLFPLQCNNRGKPYGWYWMPGAQLELTGIELGEALTLALLDDTLKTMLPLSLRRGVERRFQQARRKLEALAEENA